MINIIPGHVYELKNHEGDSTQRINFIQKSPRTPNDLTLETVMNGTTNEEVLEVLIDRIQFLNEKMHSEYNMRALEHLHAALKNLNTRTASRVEAGVEGTAKEI